MAAMAANEYASRNRLSRSRIKRASHAARFRTALELADPQPGDTILDYGAGDGHFLLMVEAARPGLTLVGYDPVPTRYEILKNETGGIEVTADLSSLSGRTFSKIICLEVLEHLNESLQAEALTNMARMLSPGGWIVVSVPLEIGLGSLAKNFVRALIHQAHPGATVKTVLRSSVGLSVKSPYPTDTEYRPGHIGFDHRQLEKRFRKLSLHVTRKTFSPFPTFRSGLNSQVFYVLSVNTKTHRSQ